jgi:hypothetical protein
MIYFEDSKFQLKGVQISYQDLLTCLLISYKCHTFPSFSLDPLDAKNANGPYYKKVYYPDIMRGTEMGDTLYITDYLMKCFLLGVCVSDEGKGTYTKCARAIPELPT